jgi:aminoglycoside 6'-N-acetyltransferase I
VLVAETETGAMVGVAELSVRDDIPSLEGKRTGYVEGLYVTPEYRHTGLAQKMLQASRTWAREQNCVAFGSDRAERIIIDNSFTA